MNSLIFLRNCNSSSQKVEPKFTEMNNVRLCLLLTCAVSVISNFSIFHTRKFQLCNTPAIKMNSQGAFKLLLRNGF